MFNEEYIPEAAKVTSNVPKSQWGVIGDKVLEAQVADVKNLQNRADQVSDIVNLQSKINPNYDIAARQVAARNLVKRGYQVKNEGGVMKKRKNNAKSFIQMFLKFL